MKTSTGYCWMLQNEVDIAQHAYVTMSRWIQQDAEDAGVEIPLNYPELEGDLKRCAQFKYLSNLCKITGADVDESFDDTTKRVIIHDVEPLIGRSKWLNERQKARDLYLDLIAEGLS